LLFRKTDFGLASAKEAAESRFTLQSFAGTSTALSAHQKDFRYNRSRGITGNEFKS
jgi:hypothetical protein